MFVGGEDEVEEDVRVALVRVAMPLSDVDELVLEALSTRRVTEFEEVEAVLPVDEWEVLAAAKLLEAAAVLPVSKELDATVNVLE